MVPSHVPDCLLDSPTLSHSLSLSRVYQLARHDKPHITEWLSAVFTSVLNLGQFDKLD